MSKFQDYAAQSLHDDQYLNLCEYTDTMMNDLRDRYGDIVAQQWLSGYLLQTNAINEKEII